jgi:hypothetical protein
VELAVSRGAVDLATTSPARSFTGVDLRSRDGIAPDIPICGIYWDGTTDKNNPEHFTNIQTMSGIPEKVTESSSATHTLGIAVKYSGQGWSTDGTSSISRSASTSASETHSKPYSTFNGVNFRNYSNTCAQRAEKHPYSFYDILTADGRPIGTVWFDHCGNHAKNSDWDTGTASNKTYGAGADLGVINVSAHSGYSSSLNLHYTFNVKGEVCGNSSNGPAQSSLVEADTGSVG